MRRLRAAVKKEFLQFSRDWMLIGLILFIYTGDVIMCTYALSFEVRNLTLALYDQDRTQLSQRLLERFTATEYFVHLVPVSAFAEVDRRLDAGEADLALLIPPGFSEAAARGSAEIQIVLSGVNSNTANAARGYAAVILQAFSHDLMREAAARSGLSNLALPEVEPRLRIWYNPQLQFRQFMVISMIVVAGLMVGVITMAAGFVREKESGTAEQLAVTPLRQHEVMLAKAAPPFAIGMLSLLPSLGIALWFGVPMHGSLALFFAASAASLFSSMAIGIFIATYTRTLQQALLVSFFVLFPIMFLSGTVVPVESMPKAMQYLSLASPTRYYMEIALGILLKGVGWSTLWPKFVALLVLGVALLSWSLARLKSRTYT